MATARAAKTDAEAQEIMTNVARTMCLHEQQAYPPTPPRASHHHCGLNQVHQIMSKTMTHRTSETHNIGLRSRFLALDLEPLIKNEDEVLLNSLSLSYHPVRWDPNQNQHDLLDQSTAHFQLLNNAHSYLWQILSKLNCLNVHELF
jgi:hypothetical protein